MYERSPTLGWMTWKWAYRRCGHVTDVRCLHRRCASTGREVLVVCSQGIAPLRKLFGWRRKLPFNPLLCYYEEDKWLW